MLFKSMFEYPLVKTKRNVVAKFHLYDIFIIKHTSVGVVSRHYELACNIVKMLNIIERIIKFLTMVSLS
jgi:hypothetical protein